MLCKKCGKEMSTDNLFCPNCGFKNEKEAVNVKKCPTCKKEFPADRFFCDACGGILVQGDAIQEEKPSFQQPSWNPANTASSNNVPPQPQGTPSYNYATEVRPNGTGTTPMPPYSTYAPSPVKKKSKVIPIFLTAFFITLGIFAILILISIFSDKPDDEVIKDDPIINSVKKGDKTEEKAVYDYKYSYAELPDVISLDSDARFTYSANSTEDGIAVYTYLFNDEKATDADFYQACDDYSQLLQVQNSFIYEKEYSEQQYEETDVPANYLTRDNYGVSITASAEDSSYYAYVTIFPLDKQTQNDDNQDTGNMPNYNTFLANREIVNFTFDDTVNMENGLSFSVHDVIGNYPADGTMTIDITMDLSSSYTDYYMNNGDFMVLPTDTDGNILSDAIPISLIKDSSGNNVTMPFLVNSSSYEKYTFTYAVPVNTTAFSIYASNVVQDDSSTPVYVMEVGYE